MEQVLSRPVATIDFTEASGWLAGLQQRIGNYLAYRRTLAELQELNAHELADLGLTGANMKQIAAESVYAR